MCGIAGVLSGSGAEKSQLTEQITRMTSTLSHRGPDGRGVWVEDGGQVALGHQRLSILDLSPTGNQPMRSANGRFMITFNGEIYNYPELKEELASHGVVFRGTADTEAIVEGCSVWGVERTIGKLNGIFAIAVWDKRDRNLWLARDHIGVKPLYWTQVGNLLLFGSELKAIRAHDRFKPEVNLDALGTFFRFNYIPAPHTIYQGVRKLAPGTILRVPLHGVPEERKFWDVYAIAARGTTSRATSRQRDEVTDNLEALLRDAVLRQMASDVPLGALLSGGIDSSTVVALMQAQSNQRIKTFSIGFAEEDHDEAPFAKAVAQHLGTDHEELYVSADDALRLIPRMAQWYDEPFADSSQIPTYLVSALARQRVTVALSGDGGDEIFGGYPRYARHSRAWDVATSIPSAARIPLSNAITEIGGQTWNKVMKLLPKRYQTRAGAATVLRFAAALKERNRQDFHRALMSFWEHPDAILPNCHPLATAFDDPLPKVEMEYLELSQLIDCATYLVDDILCKVDRASMAVSLEVRVPILDPRIIEFSWGIPADLKCRNGVMKWLLRSVLYRYVPRDLIERPKKGFVLPLAKWLREGLRDWAEDLLDERRLNQDGLLNVPLVSELWREHLSGAMDNSERLWSILQFLSWQREWT